jgi:2'-5' RNA ligase
MLGLASFTPTIAFSRKTPKPVPYAIELYFDDHTEALIKAIWEKLAAKGVSDRLSKRGTRPHVALAVYDDADPGEIAFQLRRLAKESAPIEARFEMIGTYCSADGVLFLCPVVSPRFFLMHSSVIKLLNPLVAGLKDTCRPNRFVPHCTIAYGLDKENLSRAVALFSNKALPIVGSFSKIGLFDLSASEDRCIYPFLRETNVGS